MRSPVFPAILASLFAVAAGAAPSRTAPSTKPAPAKPKAAPVTPAVKPAAPPTPAKPVTVDESVAFFKNGVVPHLKIQISDAELKKLREKERDYVRCTVTEDGGKEYQNVGIHLKGAAGSFRNVDDRPALTLNFDKYVDDQEFHGLDKLHLNNSVQDPTYLDEILCSELFTAAKVPAARVSHARVWLNSRDLGMYVLMEGFNKRFLKRHFPDANGNLYEGGFVQDLDGDVKLQSGSGPTDRSDVKAVVLACRDGDAMKRWQRVEQLLDLDQFLSFAAMEALTCHWDGYCHNRNNYRFYIEPKSGKLVFFPHGMDQMFGDTGYNAMDPGGAMVVSAVLSNPEWRGRYQARVRELAKLFIPAGRLVKRIEEHRQRLRPFFAEVGEGPAKEFDQHAKELSDRLKDRASNLTRQTAVAVAPAEPKSLKFDAAGVATLTGWEVRKETDDAKVEMVEAKGANPKSLLIATGPGGRCVASWRTKVTLGAGRYRFEGRARADGVKASQDSPGAGAGLRISGGARTNKLEGAAGWTLLSFPLEITEPSREVELVAELRATAGQVWFDAASLRIVRAK